MDAFNQLLTGFIQDAQKLAIVWTAFCLLLTGFQLSFAAMTHDSGKMSLVKYSVPGIVIGLALILACTPLATLFSTHIPH